MSGELLPDSSHSVHARYFDGRHAVAHEVSVVIMNDRVMASGGGIERDEPLGSVSISERIGRTPRFVRFHDHAYCEVIDQAGFDRVLEAAGLNQGALTRWEQSSRLVAVLLVVLVLVVLAGYRYGLPMAAEVAAKRLPQPVLNTITNQTLALLDRSLFSPSELPLARQMQIGRRFVALAQPDVTIPIGITFRSSRMLGANAMALPNGTIIVTDDLVTLAANDEEILAVLAHEAGHVQERHGLRNVIQRSVVSVFVSWYLGDVNAIIAAAPALLMEAKYSRDLEREADDYAARFLTANHLPATLLGDILEKLERDPAGAGDESGGAAAYLSSHPTTKERIERLKAAGR